MKYVFTSICWETKEDDTYIKHDYKSAKEFLENYTEAEEDADRKCTRGDIAYVLQALERLELYDTERFVFADCDEFYKGYDFEAYCVLTITAV